MILIATFLTGIACCCLVIGGAILAKIDRQSVIDRKGDQAIIATWLGVLVLINLLLALSLCMPLTPRTGITAISVLLLSSLLCRENRRFLGQLFQSSSVSALLGLTGLALGAAAYCSQVIVWGDSGLYHLQVTKWISEYGLVPGLALIHSRFGFISSWFVLPAFLNHGFLQDRLLSLAGALCLFLMLSHGLVAFVRMIGTRGRFHDLFMVAASCLAISIIMVWGMPNSPSPDFPVMVLTITTAWAMLVISERNTENRGAEGALNYTIIPLLLGIGAATIKLSAAPLVIAAACFYVFRTKMTIRKLLVSSLILLISLAPTAIAGLLTSGCMFYPASLFCMELPWSLGADLAASESHMIRDWARWGGKIAPEYATHWNWIPPWIQAEKVSLALIILSFLAIIYLYRVRKLSAYGSIIALAVSGMAFMFYGAPTWRFGLGYLVIVPALAIAVHGKLQGLMNIKIPKARNFGVIGIMTGILVAVHIHILPRPSYKLLDESIAEGVICSKDNPHFNFILPPRVWNIGYDLDETTGKVFSYKNEIVVDAANDFLYHRPERSDTCWNTSLPCTPYKLYNLMLREPDNFQGGFVRSDPLL
jgi:hypothetical protein